MLKMIGNNAILKQIHSDDNGILHLVNPHENYSNDPYYIIYVNGSQEKHYTKDGKGTGLLMPGQATWGHNCDFYIPGKMQAGIFKFRADEKSNSDQFSQSLLTGLKKLDTNKIILVGKSYGGIIVARLNDSELVEQIIGVNPVIQKSPLADEELYKVFDYGFNPLNRMVQFSQWTTFKRELKRDGQIGFTNEKMQGLPLDSISNVKKLTIYGGTINHLNPGFNIVNIMMKSAANVIYEMSDGKKSDGTVIFEKEEYEKNNIKVTDMKDPYHQQTQNPHYMKLIVQDAVNEKVFIKR